MRAKSRKKTKPKVKSNKQATRTNGKLGWSQSNKNYNTLKKIIKAKDDEKQ